MNITKPRFNLEEICWIMYENKVMTAIVAGINIVIDRQGTVVSYNIVDEIYRCGTMADIEETSLFKDKKTLIASL